MIEGGGKKAMSICRVVQTIGGGISFLLPSKAAPFFSQFRSKHSQRSSFGIAFDIDGVILGGNQPIGGSPQALRRLYCDSGALKVPFLFLTNGGGTPERKRAVELSKLLGVNILPSQLVQGHSPFKNFLKRYENELIIATGKGEPTLVMSEYGFKNVISLDDYASCFKDIDPVYQYKMWTTKQAYKRSGNSIDMLPNHDDLSTKVAAVFIVSDPVDWGRDIQVLCDVLRSGGLPGHGNGSQPPLYFAADDLQYQAAFPSERLGMGSFRIALQSIFNRIHHEELKYVTFGKPNSSVFNNAEAILSQLEQSCYSAHHTDYEETGSDRFKTLYMIGDNPSVDIKGARKAGHPWVSILTRTGVFRGEHNHPEFPADLVFDEVEDAVDYILKKECVS